MSASLCTHDLCLDPRPRFFSCQPFCQTNTPQFWRRAKLFQAGGYSKKLPGKLTCISLELLFQFQVVEHREIESGVCGFNPIAKELLGGIYAILKQSCPASELK